MLGKQVEFYSPDKTSNSEMYTIVEVHELNHGNLVLFVVANRLGKFRLVVCDLEYKFTAGLADIMVHFGVKNIEQAQTFNAETIALYQTGQYPAPCFVLNESAALPVRVMEGRRSNISIPADIRERLFYAKSVLGLAAERPGFKLLYPFYTNYCLIEQGRLVYIGENLEHIVCTRFLKNTDDALTLTCDYNTVTQHVFKALGISHSGFCDRSAAKILAFQLAVLIAGFNPIKHKDGMLDWDTDLKPTVKSVMASSGYQYREVGSFFRLALRGQSSYEEFVRYANLALMKQL